MEGTKDPQDVDQFQTKIISDKEKYVRSKLRFNSTAQNLLVNIADQQQVENRKRQNQKRKRLLLNLFQDNFNVQDQSDTTKTISPNHQKQQIIKLEQKQNEKDLSPQPQKENQPINNPNQMTMNFDEFQYNGSKHTLKQKVLDHGLKPMLKQKVLDHGFKAMLKQKILEHGLKPILMQKVLDHELKKNILKQKVLDHSLDIQGQRVNSVRQTGRDFFIVNRKLAHKQKQLLIEGRTLYFPYEAYPAQISYMSQVLRSLDKSQNAVLQSPTGTGKTLCLLSSALTWIQDHFRKTGNKVRLIYMSRTHSQLSQVQKELEKTCFRPNMAVFGSRQQLCIKGEFALLKGREKIQACGRAVKLTKKILREKKQKIIKEENLQHGCQFYRNKEDIIQISRRRLANQVLNIEKMKKIGKQEGFCPYFYPYEIKQQSSLVLMPYNYLLDAYLLGSYVDIIEGSIIVFDQAHNVAEAACEGRSLVLDSQTLETAVAQLSKIQTGFHSKNLTKIKQDHHREIVFMLTKLEDYQQNFKRYFKENIKNQTRRDSFNNEEDDIRVINKERSIQNLFQLFSGGLTDQQQKMFTKRGQFFRKQLRTVLLNPLEELITYANAFIECLKQTIDGSFNNLQKCIIFCVKVHELLRPFAFNFSEDSPDLQISHFRFYLRRNGNAASYTVGLRCLVPWLTFSSIKKCNPRCIVLTSGTLKPLDLWQKQLQLKFNGKLVNSHVIQAEQIKAQIITHGPSNCLLNFSYDNMQRNKQKMFNSLIGLIIQLAHNIPNGILLVFPSFRLQTEFKFQLNKSSKRQILWSCKDLFFQEKNSDVDMQKFKKRALSSKGALLAIICRGKVSEGIDFPDGMCRSVILVGIPYPNVKDPFIIEKKNHLDNLANRGPNRSLSLKGDEWYMMGTIRTINQALGRVIRHARDYGTVFFVDSRYGEPKFRKELPSWITNSLDVIQQISSFYVRMQTKYDKFIKKHESQSQQMVEKEPQNAFNKMMFQRPGAQREKNKNAKYFQFSKTTNPSKDKFKKSGSDFL